MARFRLVLTVLGVACGALADVTVTPWCQDSMRIQVTSGRVGAIDPSIPTALTTDCGPGKPSTLAPGASAANGNLRVSLSSDGSAMTVSRSDTNDVLFTATSAFGKSSLEGFESATLTLKPGDASERVYGLGQGDWANPTGCATGDDQRVVPLMRNGQTINLHQRKFYVAIPFAYSTAGYGFLFNMPGYGNVTVGERGTGGMVWRAEAIKGLDVWFTALPKGAPSSGAEPIYTRYADATGHAPSLREDAMIFWQSRNRYKSSAIAMSVAERYASLGLPVGMVVVDYKNQVNDGDFAPNPNCYPSVSALSSGVRKVLNATTSFSFWPEALAASAEYETLNASGCLINSDLGGRAIDTTPKRCRDLIWDKFLKPRYYDQGVSAYWLDETDGEGTGGGDGAYGYDTSYGPAVAYSNLWVNSWLQTFTEPVAKQGDLPLVLTRGVWAGGQRNGVVLWSSDIESTFLELTVQLNLGVHASLSGIPWWTSDVGGYGCGRQSDNDSPTMKELIVRWYQFGCFSPVFRTHGCRNGPSEPDVDPCVNVHRSCGYNEVWSYGSDTQVVLEKYIRVRASLKPYIAELDRNVTKRGVPTVRPLWWEFPDDGKTVGIDDQYLLGPSLLVAPVTRQGQTSRSVYFPEGADWKSFWDESVVVKGGTNQTVQAPLDTIPVYWRV